MSAEDQAHGNTKEAEKISVSFSPWELSVPIVFAALTVLMTWPLAPQADRVIANYDDCLTHTWALAWDWYAILHQPLHIFQANIYSPFPNTLATLDHLFGVLPFAGLIRIFGGSPISAHNLSLVMGIWLSAITMYLLVRSWTRNIFAAFVAGSLFAFHPIHLFQVHEVHVAHMEFLPLILLALDSYVFSKGWKWWWVLLVAFLWNSLMAFYVVYIGGWIAIIWAGVALAREGRGTINRRTLLGGLIFTLVTVVTLATIYRPYFKLSGAGTFSRSMETIITSTPIFPDAFVQRYPNGANLGFAMPILALLGLMLSRKVSGKSRTGWWMGAICTAAGLILSLGPFLVLASGPTRIPLPTYVLYKAIPMFSAFRNPAYWGILTLLGCSIMAGYGVNAFLRRLHNRGRTAAVITLIITLGLLADAYPYRLTLLPIRKWNDRPEYYRWLAKEGPVEPRLEFPTGILNNFTPTCLYMAFSAGDPRPMIRGVSSVAPPGFGTVEEWALKFPEIEAVRFFRALGTKWVMVHHDAQLEPAEWKISDLEKGLPYGLNAELARSNAEETVYQIPAHRSRIRIVALESAFTNQWIFSSRATIKHLFDKIGVGELALRKNSGAVERDVLIIEPLADANTSEQAGGICLAIIKKNPATEGLLRLSMDQWLPLINSCSGDQIVAAMKASGVNRIALGGIITGVDFDPFKGLSSEELSERGLVYSKKVGNVDIYEIVGRETLDMGPLSGRCDFSFPSPPYSAPPRAIISLSHPEGMIWKNPSPGAPFNITCRFHAVGSDEGVTKIIPYIPAPVLMPGERFSAEWNLPAVDKRGKYVVTCSGDGVQSFETNVVILPMLP